MSTVTSVSSTSTTTTSSSSDNSSIDMEEFLEILVTQLQNQNPLEPTDVTEYTNQLVGYSQLGEQTETNDLLSDLSGSITSMLTSNSADYIGKSAEIDSADAPVQDGKASWTYSLDANAETTSLVVTNQDGDVVWSGSGEVDAGTHSFSLSADDLSGVEEGDVLTLTSVSADADGAGTRNDVTAFATIDAVTFADGDTAYQAGDAVFSSDDILTLYGKA